MKFSIIVIGDELLIGQVTDTNSGWIARNLRPMGFEVDTVQVVADDAQAITHAIDEAFSRTKLVLMTGGLGPTKDDITKSTLCRYFGGELRHDEVTARNVEKVVSARRIKLNDYTRTQAMVPSSCRVIQNEVGTAPIMWFEKEGRVLVSMPGVPFETETMMQREVIPQLVRHFHCRDHIEHRTLIVTGIIESALAMRLDQFERSLPDWLHLAYLPNLQYIRLRLTGALSDAEALNTEMERRVAELHFLLGDLIISDEDLPLATIVGNALRRGSFTLATAESCTGGNIAHVVTEIAGSSDYFKGTVVAYSNEVKRNVLGVSPADLDTFGAVSEAVVRQMVEGACRVLGTDCAVATSGVAGPGGGSVEKPVGTVWIAVKCGDRVEAECKHFEGDRSRIINRATSYTLLKLLAMLRD